MIRRSLCAVLAAASLLLFSCTGTQEPNPDGTGTPPTPDVALLTGAADAEDMAVDIQGEFSITSESGKITAKDNRYLIGQGGEYTLRGVLAEGQIYVNAPDEKVTLILDGASLSSAKNAVIFIAEADGVTIKCAEGSYNELHDTRPLRGQNVNDSTTGSGCVFADADLKLSGKGALVVESSYAHGIHTKKDLSVKNVTLKVTAPDCALRGNDTVTIDSGNLVLISTGADGIKTSNSDISSKGNQRGTVTIDGASVDIYAACDGIDAAYDVVIGDAGTPTVNIYTHNYSSHTATVVAGSWETNPSESSSGKNGWFSGFGGMREENPNKSSHSAKGIKAHNELLIHGGDIAIQAGDDALHAEAASALENGRKGKGNVTINGSGVQLLLVCADDAIHADDTLTVHNGQIDILGCYEGLEATTVDIRGGSIEVYADDDGINASGSLGVSSPTVRISGGYLSVTVGNGDTDALDTNGLFELTGGTLVVRGSGQGMASALDIERICSVTGGTLICSGNAERLPTPTEDCCMVVFGALSDSMGPGSMGPGGMGPGGKPPHGTRPGEHTPEGGAPEYTIEGVTYTVQGTDIRFTVPSVKNLWIMSDQLEVGSEYTLIGGDDNISWMQSSAQTQVN
jgi:hypothetical protein